MTRFSEDEAQDWMPISGFPGYSINPFGDIANDRRGIALRYDVNQVGIVHVSLYYNGRQYRRSVAKMVAQAFLEPPKFSHFNTITHKDGDRQNFYVDNLAWRPRWYSIEYHRQFDEPPDPSWENVPVEIPKYNEFYDRAIDFCMEHCVLLNHVVDAVLYRKPIPLLWIEVYSPDVSPVY